VATAVGELRNVELPDGSTVLVNTNTRIETAYSAAERRVRLVHGEAHFTVAKNPVRPFYVEANGVAVRAVGTAFNVRLRSDSVEVLVTEGRVRVADTTRGTSLIAEKSVQVSTDEAPLLRAGERAVVAGSVAPGGVRQPVPAAAVTASEVGRVLAWQDRRLEFGAVPLSEIVAEFNRYNRVQLVVEEPALAAQRFGGSFRVDQPDTLVRLLEDRFGVRAERSKAEIVLRRGPASAP
jgi:transmembrane sensor